MNKLGALRIPTLVLIGASLFDTSAHATTASWYATTPGLETQPTAVVQTVDGITITARGYVAEYGANGAAGSTIYGPFPTSTVNDGNWQVFGPLGTHATSPESSDGLGLIALPVPGIPLTGVDYGGQAVDPGLGNHYYGDNPDIPGPPREKIDFVIFNFSQPVSISTIGVGGNGYPIWTAGWTSAPGLEAGLNAMFSTSAARYTTTGGYSLTVQGMTGISFLAIGSPTQGENSFGLPVSSGGIYIRNLQISAVPEPSEAATLLVGLAILGAKVKRRRITGTANPSLKRTPNGMAQDILCSASSSHTDEPIPKASTLRTCLPVH